MVDVGVWKGFIILKVNDQFMCKVSDFEEVMKVVVKLLNQVFFFIGVFFLGKCGYYVVDLIQE